MNDVVADAEDTDVVVMCACAVHKINETLGLKRQQSIYDYREHCTKEIAELLYLFILIVEEMLFQASLVKERRPYSIK